jgi:4-carboxymuconolactone decarboxylase
LNIKARELITFTVIAALGGCEGQLKSHTAANLREGASADDLIDTLVVCMPYNGFPRTLNALACVNAAAK